MLNMKCEICGKPDPKLLIILPLHQADGRLDTIVCEECARKSKAYCLRHQRPHLGFMDGSTACIHCIEELVRDNMDVKSEIMDRVCDALPRDQAADLVEAAEAVSSVMRCSESQSILRFVATKAMRSFKAIGSVIEEIERVSKSGRNGVNYLLR